MDSILVESPALAKPPGFGCLSGGACDSLLKDSIDRFLGEIRQGSCDLSGFHSIFFRLLQSRADPPLEVVWFYSAVSYYGNFSSTREVLGRVCAVRDLLQLLVACSVSCGGQKSIALLAPVVYELQRITFEVEKSREDFSGNELKKLRKEIYLLAEGVLSYISICCGKNSDRDDGAFTCLAPCFVDLVGIWTARWADGGDALQEFFPLVNDEIRNAFRKPGCCEVRHLSGAVMAEMFFLMLRLKLQKRGASSPALRSELKIWVVGSVTGFGNLEFFEILLMMLMDGALPSSLLLNPAEEVFLRDTLYDSVILVDYSFLYPDEGEENRSSIESAYVALLIVTHQAIQLVRERGDQSKLAAYINAFSRSALLSALTKSITNKLGVEKVNGRTVTSPEALLKLLLKVEDRGCKLQKFDLSRLRGSLLPDEMDDDTMFFFDSGGNSSTAKEKTDGQKIEMMDAMFLSAARSIKSTSRDGRKRKGSKVNGERRNSKLVKHKAGEMSEESDVEDPPSDEMEDSD